MTIPPSRPPRPATLADLVTETGARRRYGPGELVFLEGDRSDSVYACVSGRIKISIGTPCGRELMLGIKGPGTVFGELSAIDGAPRSASALVLERSEVAVMSGDELLRALERSPQLGLVLLRELSEYLRESNQRAAAHLTEPTHVRAARRLLHLASSLLRHGAPDGHIVIPITQDDLAAWIGATREATARALARFRRAGAIHTGRGRILVLDRERLAAFVA